MLYEKTEAQGGGLKITQSLRAPKGQVTLRPVGLKAKAVASTLCRTNSAVHYYGMLVCKISSNP